MKTKKNLGNEIVTGSLAGFEAVKQRERKVMQQVVLVSQLVSTST